MLSPLPSPAFLSRLFSSLIPPGKPASTRWHRRQVFYDDQGRKYSLLEVHPLTGRTHQIRAHMAHLGWPLAGDTKYGSTKRTKAQLQTWCPRLFLHAACLEVRDLQGGPWRVSAPLTPDLQAALASLHSTSAP